MKKPLGLTLAAALLLSACAAETPAQTPSESKEEAIYQAGTYQGTGKGNNGDVKVEVVFTDTSIASVTVTEHSETAGISDGAIEEIPKAIIETQGTEGVDTVSGATNSSNAILDAVKDAIRQASLVQEESAGLIPGTYEGTGTGMKGLVKVSITVDENGKVTNVSVTDHKETDGIYQAAFERVPAEIVAGQTLNVDAATGATVSSKAIVSGVREALEKAGGADGFAMAPAVHAEAVKAEDREADIVVIGSGLAGLLSALRAAEAGYSVVVLEKNAYAGGSTARCAGYFYAANSEVQIDAGAGIDETFMDGLYDAAAHPYMNKYLYTSETEALDHMIDLGIEFVEPDQMSLKFAPGLGKGGGAVVRTLVEAGEKNGVEFLYETTGEELLAEDGTVVGVTAQNRNGETFNISSRAVILASGGWAYNKELNAEYAADTQDAPRGGNAYAEGDAFTMAAPLNARLINMNEPSMAYAMAAANYQYLSFAYTCGILVDQTGKRFFDESNGAYPALDAAVIGIDNNYHYGMVYDLAGEAFCGEEGLMESLRETGVAKEYSSLEELAEAENLPDLLETVETYNGYVEAGEDPEFGRNPATMQKIETGNTKYYYIDCTIGYYTSVGGIDVDLDGRVLNNDGDVIPGLYAAGEVTGNMMFRETGNYGGGVATAIGGGWAAGTTAAEDLASSKD